MCLGRSNSNVEDGEKQRDERYTMFGVGAKVSKICSELTLLTA
jgi:hypothetical protein